MWVRTQSSEGLVDVSYFELKADNPYSKEETTHLYGSEVYLGTFNSKSRAIAELDYIERSIFADKDHVLVYKINERE